VGGFEEEGDGDWTAKGSPEGAPEVGCTWPLQARMWDFRFRPPVVLSTVRKSATFFAAWPGSFKRFFIFTGATFSYDLFHCLKKIGVLLLKGYSRDQTGAIQLWNHRFP
jgi:hypothetical protein